MDDLADVYECPVCFYLINDIQIQYARLDYLCPRCGEKKLSEFNIRRWSQPCLSK
jgi:predicted RNA-binding Zn-ribbon protein involved in translation (DUF1610 family)